jgi:hypothetical protein
MHYFMLSGGTLSQQLSIQFRPMDEAVILQSLEQACPGLDLYFQIIVQPDTLYIYINRQAGEKLNYKALTLNLKRAIAALELPDVQWMILFSRVLGATDPDWQSDALSITEPEISDETLSDDPTVTASHTELDDVLPDHPSTETIEEGAEPSPTVSIAPSQSIEPDDLNSPEDHQQADDISQYCFIQNKALVTSDVLPPEANITALVEALHQLSDPEKLSILPRLEPFFKTQQLESAVQDSEAIAEFCEKLRSLKGFELRKASIWISRYCHNPQQALEQSGVVARSAHSSTPSGAVELEEPVDDDPLQQYSVNVRHKPVQSGLSYESYRAARNQKPARPKFSWQLLVIPVLWTLFTLIGVCYSVQANHGPDAIARICKNTKGQPEYCKLAVQLVGTDTYKTYSKQTSPTEPMVVEKASQECMLPAILNTGVTLRDLKEDKYKETYQEIYQNSGPPRPTSHELSPGFFVLDVNWISPKDKTTSVRTACVFGTVQNKISQTQSPKLLASEVIPNQWPQVPLKKKPAQVKVADAQSLHGFLTLLGTNALFAAIGLFIIMFLNLGIRVGTLNALYQAAFIFSAIDVVISAIPMIGHFHFIRFTAVPVVGLMITSIFVKEMELDLSVGYKVLAMAGGILVGIRFLCNWLLLAAIMSML